MKLKTKILLPLAGVATACTAVTPLFLTSCGTNENDLTQWYVPKVTALEQNTVTRADAIKTYFGSEDENGWVTDTTIIQDDIKWATSMMLNIANYSSGTKDVTEDLIREYVVDSEDSFGELVEEKKSTSNDEQGAAKYNLNLDYDYYNMTIDSIYFGQTYDATGKIKCPTVSLTLSYDYKYDSTANQTSGTLVKKDVSYEEGIWHFAGTYTVTNLPVTLAYVDAFNTGDSVFTIAPDGEMIKAQLAEGAEFKTVFSIIDEYSYEGEVINYNRDGTETTTTKVGSKVLSLNNTSTRIYDYLGADCPINWPSHYLFSWECSDWGK